MFLFDLFKKRENVEADVKKAPSAKEAPRTLKKETFEVAGVSYYMVNVKKLYCSNPEWKKNRNALSLKDGETKKIFRYTFIQKPVYLIPEPTNKHDKNAILVQVAGEKVGYISQDENIHVKNILDKHDVKYISAFFSGGEYKIVSNDGVIGKGEYGIKITVRIGYV